MRRAGFHRLLGIENILEGDLEFLRASAKNTERTNSTNTGNATLKAIDYLHRNQMYVVSRLIVGSPSDTRESITKPTSNLPRRYVDWP